METEEVSAWVRTLGWRVCIANAVAELRRSPRVNGDKVGQEIVNGPKDMGENSGGVEQTRTNPEKEKERQFAVERIVVVTKTLKEQ